MCAASVKVGRQPQSQTAQERAVAKRLMALWERLRGCAETLVPLGTVRSAILLALRCDAEVQTDQNATMTRMNDDGWYVLNRPKLQALAQTRMMYCKGPLRPGALRGVSARWRSTCSHAG